MDSLRANRLNGSWLPRINTKHSKSLLAIYHKRLTMHECAGCCSGRRVACEICSGGGASLELVK